MNYALGKTGGYGLGAPTNGPTGGAPTMHSVSSSASSGSPGSLATSGATTPLMRTSPSAMYYDVHHGLPGHLPQFQYLPIHQKPPTSSGPHAPGLPNAAPHAPVPVNYGHNYYQPVYYTIQRPPPTPPHSHYSVPEVINKPTNKCHRCGTTETPEWRRGPNGVRTLCNACGLFHAKLVKRKGAALAAAEVLNNKVCKGKNGRRIAIKKHLPEMKPESALGSPTATAFPAPPGPLRGYDHSYTTAVSRG